MNLPLELYNWRSELVGYLDDDDPLLETIMLNTNIMDISLFIFLKAFSKL